MVGMMIEVNTCFDSTEGNLTLFGQTRQGWLFRINKYAQSTGSVVWKLCFRYHRNKENATEIAQLNVYGGGTFGSDSTWDYSRSEDSWTIRFANAECEEFDVGDNTGTFTYLGKISFTMLIKRIQASET